MNKKISLFGFFIFILAFSSVNADDNWAIWENEYASLSVFPNLSQAPLNIQHEQTAYLHSKLGIDYTFSYAFEFSEQLISGYMSVRSTTYTENGTINYTWTDITDDIQYLEYNNNHYYYQLNKQIQANGTIVVKFGYRTSSPIGKWNLRLWTGSIYNPDVMYVLDPYWGEFDSGNYNSSAESSNGATGGFYYKYPFGVTSGQTDNFHDVNGTLWTTRTLINITNGTGASYNYSSYQVSLLISNVSSNENQFLVIRAINTTHLYELPHFLEEFNTTHVNLTWAINFSVFPETLYQDYYIYFGNTSENIRSYSIDNVFSSLMLGKQIVYLKFTDGTGVDSSTNGNTFTVSNAVGRDTNVRTNVVTGENFSNEGAMYFDGSGDRVYSSIDTDSDATWSWSWWMNESTESTYARWVTTTTGGLGGGSICLRSESGNYIVLYVNGASYVKRNDITYKNSWHHFVMTSDGADTKLYFDGSSTPILTHTYSVNPQASISLGGYYSGGAEWLKGYMDEFMIYRYTLTTDEILRLYRDSLYSSTPPILNLDDEQSGIPNLSVNSSVDYGDVQVDTQQSITITFENSGLSPATITTYTSNSSDYTSSLTTLIIPSESSNTTTMYFQASQYYDANLTGLVTWVVDNSIWTLSNESTIGTGLSSTPTLTYSTQNIDFGDIQVDTESAQSFLNLTNEGSANNITITGITLNSNFTDINSSYDYTIDANSNLLLYFIATPPLYTDTLFNQTFTWSVDETYGSIGQDIAYLAYLSSTPTLDVKFFVNYTNIGYGVSGNSYNITRYQEDSDAYDGDYWEWGGGFYGSDPIFDGDWTTGTRPATLDHPMMFINYTKPLGSYSALWQVKDYDGIENLSVLNYFDGDSELLMFRMNSTDYWDGDVLYFIYEWDVWDGSNWITLRTTTDHHWESAYIYEEGVFWNITIYDENEFGDLQVDTEFEVIVYLKETGGTNNLTINSISANNTMNYDLDVFPYAIDAGSTSITILTFIIDRYYDSQYIHGVVFNCTATYGLISSYTTIMYCNSSTPTLTYQKNNIDFGDVVIDTTSPEEYLNLTDTGSPNNITITGIVLNGNFTDVNNTYTHTIDANSNLLLYFTTTPTFYTDQFNISFTWSFSEVYGAISQDSAYLSFNSSEPTLPNITYDYNGSYTDVLPEDVLPFNFSINNSNLNTVVAKYFIWTLSDCTLSTNFSEITSVQYSYNSTFAIVAAIREIESFSAEVQSVIIVFYGIGSQSSNNVFNLTITPNFTMVNFSYIYPILTNFDDCDLTTQYSDTWTLYNNYGSGGLDFDIISRSDSNAFNVSKYYNIDNKSSTGHIVDLWNLYELHFYSTSHQAEIFINLKATTSVNLKITFNGDSTKTETISVTSTSYETYSFYTDYLTINEINSLTFELSASSGLSLYIQNATQHPDLNVSKFDHTTLDYEDINDGFAIDIKNSELLFIHETPRYYDTQDNLTISSESSNQWIMYYYPQIYTNSISSTINFILIDTSSRRYLDNFSLVITCETPRFVTITSNLDDLDIVIYIGEVNMFDVSFENTGTLDAKILTANSSLSWLEAIAYEGKYLNVGESLNITFRSNSNLNSDYLNNYFTFELVITTESSGYYSEMTLISVDARAAYQFVYPDSKTITIDRNKGETKQAYFTIRNSGYAEGNFEIRITEPSNSTEESHNSLNVDTSFSVDYASGLNEYDIIITITGLESIQNETWVLSLYLDDVQVDEFTIIVNTSEELDISWIYMIILLVVSIIAGIGAIFGYYKYKKRNAKDMIEIVQTHETNTQNYADYSKKDFQGPEPEYIDTSKKESKITRRNILIALLSIGAIIIFMIPFILYFTGAAEPVWQPMGDLI